MNALDNDEVITEYTKWEGGNWLKWEGLVGAVPTESELDAIKRETYSEGTVLVNHKRLHSFRTSVGREWDTFNGFRTQIS